MKEFPRRKGLRLKDFDYSSAGYYFVTICVRDRRFLFGNIVDGIMQLNELGIKMENRWHELSEHFSNIELDEFVVMPNHIHGILAIVGAPLVGARNQWTRADTRPAPTSLGDIICVYKSISTNDYINGIKQNHSPSIHGKLWQRNYFDRIIRDEIDLNRIRQYIMDNPMNWDSDPENIKIKIEN